MGASMSRTERVRGRKSVSANKGLERAFCIDSSAADLRAPLHPRFFLYAEHLRLLRRHCARRASSSSRDEEPQRELVNQGYVSRYDCGIEEEIAEHPEIFGPFGPIQLTRSRELPGNLFRLSLTQSTRGLL